jgi:nucleotide-binding universal stress UspA family protein
MKTILVPTDFSVPAENAAHYAMDLAEGLKANILLCHAIKIPAETAMAPHVAWTLEDYNTVKQDVMVELQTLTKRLKESIMDKEFRPGVSCVAEIGEVADVIRNLVANERLSLVVMGMSGAGTISRFFLGSNSKALIDKANFPLLLIPPGCKFKNIHKIAFATTLDKRDIERINQLANVARLINAEILLVNVSNRKSDSNEQQKKVEDFLNDITCKINYPKIYYRQIKNEDVDNGLDWLTQHGQIDILVMVHHKADIYKNIFEGSHTQRIARHIHMPLMVFPGVEQPVSLPIF